MTLVPYNVEIYHLVSTVSLISMFSYTFSSFRYHFLIVRCRANQVIIFGACLDMSIL